MEMALAMALAEEEELEEQLPLQQINIQTVLEELDQILLLHGQQ